MLTVKRLAVFSCVFVAACDDATKRSSPVPDTSRTTTAATYRVPGDDQIPEGDVGIAIRRGRALLVATRDSLPRHVGNQLNCASCHLAAGTQPRALSLAGVYVRFPQYRARNARMNVMQDRINDCFLRSMNGRPLDPMGRDMADMISYLAFISRGVPAGRELPDHALPRLKPTNADTARGRQVFVQSCARCHGPDGQGIPPAPPVWGDKSFSIGAGLARRGIMASFVKYNMPLDMPGTLSDQDAHDVAAFIASHPRPDFKGKEHDWPKGGAPADAAYPTNAAKSPPRTSN